MTKKSNAVSFSVTPHRVSQVAAFGIAADPTFAHATTLKSHVLHNIANGRFKPSRNQANCIMTAAKSLGFEA